MASRNMTRLFIGNLPWTVGSQELRQYFREFGRIANASVVFNKNTGISKGYGFVTFFGSEAYEKVTNQKTHTLDGWSLTIQTSHSNFRN